jgi:hypothetical protein
VSRDDPRSDKWAEWYLFHPDVLATYGEADGSAPQHEWLCPDNTSRPTRPEESLSPDEPLSVADPNAPCWCSAFCGFCDHHEKHHTYGTGKPVPCKLCPAGLCTR